MNPIGHLTPSPFLHRTSTLSLSFSIFSLSPLSHNVMIHGSPPLANVHELTHRGGDLPKPLTACELVDRQWQERCQCASLELSPPPPFFADSDHLYRVFKPTQAFFGAAFQAFHSSAHHLWKNSSENFDVFK